MPAHSGAGLRIFPPRALPTRVARQQGDESAGTCDCVLQLFVSFCLHGAKQLSCGDSASKAKRSCLCFSAYIISGNGVALFSKATKSREGDLRI